jgi:hypothetical protein
MKCSLLLCADSGLTDRARHYCFGGGGTGLATWRKQVKIGQGAAAAAGLLLGLIVAGTAPAQKQGGILKVWHRDSPANMSILEEGTISIVAPIMGVFNNLVVFDPNV